MSEIPDLGARLVALILEHPDPAEIQTLYRELSVDKSPVVLKAPHIRYRAQIATPTGLKELT